MNIAVIGAGGQLGRELTGYLPAFADWKVRGFKSAEIDVVDRDAVFGKLQEAEPEVVINCAAFHRVDLCETQVARAFAVNLTGARNVAEFCRAHGAGAVFISTNYVFDGLSRRPYLETDPARPLSAYGWSKLAGETAVISALEKHAVIRTCGLYGKAGTSGKAANFVETMLGLARAGRPIRVVDDQICTPTSTAELVRIIAGIIRSNAWGVFHATSVGECSWYEFAKKIFELSGFDPDLKPVFSDEHGAAAARPAYAVLENARLKELGVQGFRHWEEALAEYLGVAGCGAAACV